MAKMAVEMFVTHISIFCLVGPLKMVKNMLQFCPGKCTLPPSAYHDMSSTGTHRTKQNPPAGKVHGHRPQSLLEKDLQPRWTSNTQAHLCTLVWPKQPEVPVKFQP